MGGAGGRARWLYIFIYILVHVEKPTVRLPHELAMLMSVLHVFFGSEIPESFHSKQSQSNEIERLRQKKGSPSEARLRNWAVG